MQEENNKKSFERSGSTRKQIRFEDQLLADIEKHRLSSGLSFAAWVKTACKEKLKPK